MSVFSKDNRLKKYIHLYEKIANQPNYHVTKPNFRFKRKVLMNC